MRKLMIAVALSCILAVAPVAAQDPQTFSGSYDWSSGGSDELIAEFTPDGDSQWKVNFSFRWSDKDHSWKGTASGSLEEGTTVRGTATYNSRNWTFEATITDGVMSGVHTEVRGDDTFDTGTFTIKR